MTIKENSQQSHWSDIFLCSKTCNQATNQPHAPHWTPYISQIYQFTMDFLLRSAADYVNRAIDRSRANIVPRAIQLLHQLLPTDPAFSPAAPPVYQDSELDFSVYDQVEVCMAPERLLPEEPFMEKEEPFMEKEEPLKEKEEPLKEEEEVTPTAPTVSVLPPGNTIVEYSHIVTISGGNKRSRRNLARQFAMCAPPTTDRGLKRRRQEDRIVRSVRSKKLPEALSSFIIRSDLLDSEEE